ncbi:MAG TPA: DUF3108 domain-containing protein [Gemmatimonadales bacterium]|jgi:hypothetical protein|nr:DUF3108 domain-containing protein [Gemmatimonadales bacterium]
MMLGPVLLLALQAPPAAPPTPPAPMPNYPFAVGERLTFSAKLGIITLGEGHVEVARIDTIRGVDAFVFRFTLEGGVPLYSLDDTLESWTGVQDLLSRRFVQRQFEGGKYRFRTYEIFPDSGVYHELIKKKSGQTSSFPIDDAGFLYFVRVTPLEVGKTYSFDRYFKKELNPVVLKVHKREQMELPDGTKVQCLVVQPIVGEKGSLFSRQSDTRVWLTDDERRIPVQIRIRFPFGVITMRLKAMDIPPRAAPAHAPPA